MHGGLPHRPGYAVVPQLEPGVTRHTIALRGLRSRRTRSRDDRFDAGADVRLALVRATERESGTGRR